MKTFHYSPLRFLVALGCSLASGGLAAPIPDVVHQPYVLNAGLESRSISFENPTGARGEGGKAASNLGAGRKGAPARDIKPGETVTLCDIGGSGHDPAHLDHDAPRSGRRCAPASSAATGTARSIRASNAPWAISWGWRTAR